MTFFGSDAISSSAYATEASLVILVAAGNGALNISFYTALAIATVLSIVAFSYRQTVHAYPQGGGSYNVSRENLGQIPGLVAAAALLIDYVLTVAASIVAGSHAITLCRIIFSFAATALRSRAASSRSRIGGNNFCTTAPRIDCAKPSKSIQMLPSFKFHICWNGKSDI